MLQLLLQLYPIRINFIMWKVKHYWTIAESFLHPRHILLTNAMSVTCNLYTFKTLQHFNSRKDTTRKNYPNIHAPASTRNHSRAHIYTEACVPVRGDDRCAFFETGKRTCWTTWNVQKETKHCQSRSSTTDNFDKDRTDVITGVSCNKRNDVISLPSHI